MAEPYIRKNPNDLIRAADWNQIQIEAREDIEQHAHSGGEQGTPIGTAGLADGAVATAKLATAAVDTARLADNAVNTAKLANNAVTFDKLAFAAVTTGAIADAAVSSSKISGGAVTTEKIAAQAVRDHQIVDGAVSAVKLANNAVVTAKLADGAVGTSKIAGGAVGTAAIANDSITFDKLAPDVRTAIQQGVPAPTPTPGPIGPIGPIAPIHPGPIFVDPSPPIVFDPSPPIIFNPPVVLAPNPFIVQPTPPILGPRFPIEIASVRDATALTAPTSVIGTKSVPTDVRPSAEARAAYQAPEVMLHPIRPSFDHVYATWSSSLGRIKDSSRAAVVGEDRAPAVGFRKSLMALSRRITKLADAGPTLAFLRVLTDHLEPEALHAGKAQAALALLGDTRLAAALARLRLPEAETHLEQALQIIDLAYETPDWAGLLLALARQCNPELFTRAGAAKTAGDILGIVAEVDPQALPEILGGLAVPLPDEVPAIALPPAMTAPQVVMEVEATLRIATQAVCAVGIGSLEVPPPPGQLTLVQGGAPARSTRKADGAAGALLGGQTTVTLRRRIRYPAQLGTARTVRLWLSAYEQPATLVDVQLRAHTLGGHDPVVEGGGIWVPA